MSISEIAQQTWCPVTAQTIYYRLRKGMNIVEAITTKPYQTHKQYMYKGKMRSLTYLSKLPECRVSKATLWQRLCQYDWPSVEDAMRMDPLPKTKARSREWQREKILRTTSETGMKRRAEFDRRWR